MRGYGRGFGCIFFGEGSLNSITIKYLGIHKYLFFRNKPYNNKNNHKLKNFKNYVIW